MHDIPFDLILGIGSLSYVATNFVTNLLAKQWSSVEKQLLAWAISVGALFLAANSDFASGYSVAGHALSTLNAWSLFFVGLMPGSVLGVAYHLGKRFDNNGTGDVPELPAPAAPPVVNPVAPVIAQGEPLQTAEPQVIHLQPVVNVTLPAPAPEAPKARSTRSTRRT